MKELGRAHSARVIAIQELRANGESGARRDVVGFSRGATSAVAGWLVAQEHPDTTILLFHDPGEEPEDNDRFASEVSAHIGIPITNYSDGRTVSQLFDDEGMLGNSRWTPCSKMLKQDLSRDYLQVAINSGFAPVLYLGFTPDESERLVKARQRYSSMGIEVRAPLLEAGMSKEQAKFTVEHCWGIRLPIAYDHFEHANCRGCVKGSLAYWGLMYLHDREMWEHRASQEDDFQHTILHSRYGAYPEGSLRSMLPRCLDLARKHEEKKRLGMKTDSLIEFPCACTG